MRDLIVRIFGVICLAVGIFIDYHADKTLNLKARALMLVKTVGGTFGSRYKVCGKDDTNLNNLIDDFSEQKVSDLKYYFYNIANPKEYLNGDDAIAVEKGPYLLKKHSVKYNIAFKASSLTDAGEPNENGAIEYDVADAYIPLDKNTDVASTMTRGDDLSLSWSDSDRQALTSYDKALPTHLSMSDEITNLSPVYLSALGEANDEFMMILSMACTPDQIKNIHKANSKSQCTSSQLNKMDESDCACCMLHDEYEAKGGASSGYVSCNSHLDDEGSVLSTLSFLAYLDGGIAIKEKDDPKYYGSGKFTETKHKQDKIYTPILQKHTINDLLFGYPSAFIGKAVPNMYLGEGEKIMKDSGISNPTRKQIGTEMLTGNMDDDLPFKIGNLASYTKDVGDVCLEKCSSVDKSDSLTDSPLGHMCSGHAKARHSTSVTDEIVLGEIDCKPYSSTYYTKKMCNKIEFILDSDPNKADTESCSCANESEDWKTSGCCLASGKLEGQDLTAEGCLFPVAGEAGTNYAGKDTGASSSAKPSIDVGKAIKAWSSNKDSAKNAQFMCPAQGVLLDEHKIFGRFEELAGSSSHDTYIHTGNARIRQYDSTHTNATTYSSPVNGAGTEYFGPTGQSAYFGDMAISNGHTHRGKHPIYTKDKMSPTMFEEDWGLTAITCDDNICHKVARLLVAADAFTGTADSKLQGIGMPFDGVQSVGHKKGPGSSGRPMYVHQPLFFNGDKELLSQQNSSYVEGESGNGLKMYVPKNHSSDPGTFSVGGTNDKYELIDETTLSAKEAHIQSHLDMEAATGLGVRSKLRFGVSYSIWECDPESNNNCTLSRHSDGSAKCYHNVGDEIYKNYDSTMKSLLDAKKSNDFTYPCSAANVFTPKVVGGKITPMYWYEDSREEIGKSNVEGFTSLAKEHYVLFDSFTWVWYLGWHLFVVFGVGMMTRCLCFAREREFLKSGAVGGANNEATMSATSSVADTGESAN